MKVRIQHGQRCIELDGEHEEIVSILTGWWDPQGSLPENLAEEQGAEEGGGSPTSKRGERKRPARKPAAAREAPAGQVDAEEVANRIRESEQFDVIERKLITTDASRIDRARFVAWFVGDQAVTSGDLMRVMNALHVKMDAPTASKAFGDASNDFLKDSKARPSTYKLTARARRAFEEWIGNGPPAA